MLLITLHSQQVATRAISGLNVHWRLASSAQQMYTFIGQLDTKVAGTAANRTALVSSGKHDALTYMQMHNQSEHLARVLAGMNLSKGARVALLLPRSPSFAVAMTAVWRSRHVLVPLQPDYPLDALQHAVDAARVEAIVTVEETLSVAKRLRPLHQIVTMHGGEIRSSQRFSSFSPPELDDPALIIYTSGTTGKPKGVVSTHRNLRAQITDLVFSWKWSAQDRILHLLPLNHVHGLVNCLLCALWSGATVEFMDFDAVKVWQRLLQQDDPSTSISLLMAVPTIYVKLIEAVPKLSSTEQAQILTACMKMRLMVCGSAPLPTSVLEKWNKLTGHFLLERYGMTEIGMALANPLATSGRRAGYVGAPLPSVHVEIRGEDGRSITAMDTPGELVVKGETVFKEYDGRPEATAEAFDKNGWFLTGDIAERSEFPPHGVSYKIVGRASVDIIKSGGFKISARHVETVMLEHVAVSEVAVVGVADETWGQRVGAVVRLKETDAQTTSAQLEAYALSKLPRASAPSLWRIVAEIPKNNMGKVNKKELVKMLF